jgi:hypothetical protein
VQWHGTLTRSRLRAGAHSGPGLPKTAAPASSDMADARQLPPPQSQRCAQCQLELPAAEFSVSQRRKKEKGERLPAASLPASLCQQKPATLQRGHAHQQAAAPAVSEAVAVEAGTERRTPAAVYIRAAARAAPAGRGHQRI